MGSNSRLRLLRAASTLALAGAPFYWLQGRSLRRWVPRLDEAPGERSGTVAGCDPAFRIAGLGESPMAAVGLADQAEALIPRLANEVHSATRRRIEWTTAARSGATARHTLEVLLPQIDISPVDVVVVGLGVNDCLSMHSAKRWREHLVALVDTVRRRLEPGRIILTGVPPMQHFPALPFPLATMLGLRSARLDAVSAQLAETSPDLYHAPMDFVEHPNGLFCRDGFHPNARAHALWARQLSGTIEVK